MDNLEVRRDAPAAVGSLREETANLRDLLRACHEGGVQVALFQERVRSTRELVAQRRFDEALRQLRELRVELLDQLLRYETPAPLPPAPIENPPVAAPPPADASSAAPRPPAWKVKLPRY